MPETDDNKIQTVTDSGVPVRQRFPNAEAFRNVFDDLAQQDEQDAKERLRVKGMIDGNPPWDPKQLEEQGQANRSNFNDRSGTAILNDAVAAHARLIFGNSRLVQLNFTPGTFPDEFTAEEISDQITRALSFVISNDRQTTFAIIRAIRDTEQTGLGFCVFDKPDDWRPRQQKRDRCFFNQTAKTDLSNLNLFYIVNSITFDEAYKLIEKAESAEYMGWNIQNLKESLAEYFYDGKSGTEEESQVPALQWSIMEEKIRNNDTWYQERQYTDFPIITGWPVERSGKVSQYIIPLHRPAGSVKYLYEGFETIESMSQVVVPIPYNDGEGELKSVKGKGHEIFASIMVSMRKLNIMNDASDLGSSFILQDRGSGNNLAFSFMRMGALTILDKGLEPIQKSFTPSLDSALAMRQVLMANLNNNVGIFRPSSETGKEAEKTAVQVQYEAARESRMSDDQRFMRYTFYDDLVQELTRRLILGEEPDEVSKAFVGYKRFWSMMTAFGIKKAQLRKLYEEMVVKLTRSIGAGSPTVKLNSLIQYKNLAGADMDTRTRFAWNRECGDLLLGPENVDRFSSDRPVDARTSGGASFAQLENNDIEEGSEVMVVAGQDHTAHAASHAALIIDYVQQYQQSPLDVDMRKFLNVVQRGVPHLLRTADFLEQNPMTAKKAEEYRQLITQLMPILNQAAAEFDKVIKAKEQERQQLIDENNRLRAELSDSAIKNKLLVAETDARIKSRDADTTNLIENRTRKQTQQMIDQHNKLASKLQNDQIEFQVDLQKQVEELRALIAKNNIKEQQAQ